VEDKETEQQTERRRNVEMEKEQPEREGNKDIYR
jgi:hypothetical protein